MLGFYGGRLWGLLGWCVLNCDVVGWVGCVDSGCCVWVAMCTLAWRVGGDDEFWYCEF